MKNVSKFLLIAMSVIVGVTLVGVISTASNDIQFEQIDYSYQITPELTIDSIDNTFDNEEPITFTPKTIDFTIDDQYLAVGVDVVNGVRIYKRNNGDYNYLPNAITETYTPTGVNFDDTNNYLVVSASNTTGLYLYDNDNDDTWSLSALPIISDTNINDVSFFSDFDYITYSGEGTCKTRIIKFDIDFNNNLFCETTIGSMFDGDIYEAGNNIYYLAVTGQTAPYLHIYKMDNEVVTKLTLSSLDLTIQGEAINWNIDGTFLAVGTANNVYIYKFENDDITLLPFDVAPNVSGGVGTVQFLEDIIYFGSNVINKYKYDPINNEFDQLVNDVTTYDTKVWEMDFNNLADHLVVADSSAVNIYHTTLNYVADPFNLPVMPTEVTNVLQNDSELTFTTLLNQIRITDPAVTSDLVTVNYITYNEVSSMPLVALLPLISVVILISSIVVYVKFK